MAHTWTHNPSRILRSEHLFSPAQPYVSAKNAFKHLRLCLTCQPQHIVHIFFHESYLKSVWGVCVCIAELGCLSMSEICNFTVSFYKRWLEHPHLLRFHSLAFLQRVKALRVYRAVPPSANLYLLFPPLNTDNQPLNCAFNAGFTDGCLSLSHSL